MFPLLTSSKGVKGWYPLKSIEEEIVGTVKLHAFFTSIDDERMSASDDSSYSALWGDDDGEEASIWWWWWGGSFL